MSELKTKLAKIEAALDSCFDEKNLAAVFPGLGEMRFGQTASLYAPCRDLLSRGGKRWRPLLALLSCEASGGGDAVLPLVPLVEFCHNASLIHDDIEDSSPERRGKPAVHILYGLDAALNAGAFFYFLPLASLEKWDAPAEIKNRVWALWAEHMRRLHLGQSWDIAWHRDAAFFPKTGDYMAMCRLKTGCLARFAALLGALASETCAGHAGQTGASGSAAEKAADLGDAAEKLGVGFQILDDVKNLAEGVPGKSRGDDVVEGKKSLPVILYLENDDDGERRRFTLRCFEAAKKNGVAAPEVAEFCAALDAAGILAEARKRGEALIDEAGKVFADCGIPAYFTDMLK
jgi:octaprenyl-diphosphate synthase